MTPAVVPPIAPNRLLTPRKTPAALRSAAAARRRAAVPPTRFEALARAPSISPATEWATEFARELRRDGDDYRVLNGLGEFYFRIDADEATGVIGMFVGPTKEQMAVLPTRAVALPDGRTAYSFTMFQPADMPDELFEAQHASLLREFRNIERLLNTGRAGDRHHDLLHGTCEQPRIKVIREPALHSVTASMRWTADAVTRGHVNNANESWRRNGRRVDWASAERRVRYGRAHSSPIAACVCVRASSAPTPRRRTRRRRRRPGARVAGHGPRSREGAG